MKKLLPLLITLISFSAYPQEGMVLIEGYEETFLDEFKYYRDNSTFDYEQFPEIDTVYSVRMPRRIRGKIQCENIILNSYYSKYPNLYRVNFLYYIGQYYGLKPQKLPGLNVMNSQIDPKKEANYKFRRSKKADITDLIKILEDYKPLKTN